MKILPRSRRGTWLLSGAAWLAACAVLWAILPVKQHTVRLAESEFIGFSPNFGLGIVQRWLTDDNERKWASYALELVDLETGRFAAQLIPRMDRQDLWGASADGGFWFFAITTNNSVRMVKVDLSNRRIIDLKMPAQEGNYWACQLSRDGRLASTSHQPDLKVTRILGAVYMRGGDDCNLILWDVANDRMRGQITNCRPPYAFSADGRFLVGIDNEYSIVVVDTETVTRRAQIRQSLTSIHDLAISDDGEFVAGQFYRWNNSPAGGELVVKCWSVSQGRMVIEDSLAPPVNGFSGPSLECKLRFTAGGKLVLLPNFTEPPCFRCYDIQTGRSITDQFPAEPLTWDLSPDSRVLTAFRDIRTNELLAEIAWKLGFNWEEFTKTEVLILDTTTGREIGAKSWSGGAGLTSGIIVDSPNPMWSPDGKTLISTDQPTRIATLFDIPPRKSLKWFAAGAALLALPIALIARHRVRRLRAA